MWIIKKMMGLMIDIRKLYDTKGTNSCWKYEFSMYKINFSREILIPSPKAKPKW